MADTKLVYLIAGEASGDLLGAGLMAALKRARAGVKFSGIGGPRMIAEGLAPLFPMEDLSVMGLVEVVAHLPRLVRRINQTVADILAKEPTVVIGIDAPDFCFRVERKVRKANPAIKLMHYVAPSVWAWRPGRAKKIAAFLDHLLALLPFEPPYFEAVGLPCTFVGHPAVASLNGHSDMRDSAPGIHNSNSTWIPSALRAGGNDKSFDDKQVILLLPGSRTGEVARLLPLFLEVAKKLTQNHPDLFFAFPTVPHVAPLLRNHLAGFGLPHEVIENSADKANAFAAARAALAASGTVALELALAKVPSVICYRVSSLSAWIAYRLVKLAHVSLPNLVLGREIMPEFLQNDATPEAIIPALEALLADTQARAAQLAAADELVQALSPNGVDPNVKAAQAVLNLMDAH